MAAGEEGVRVVVVAEATGRRRVVRVAAGVVVAGEGGGGAAMPARSSTKQPLATTTGETGRCKSRREACFEWRCLLMMVGHLL